MDREEALDAIDSLMDEGLALSLKVLHLDPELSGQISRHHQAWRDLALKLGNIETDGLESLHRHLRRKGE